MALLSVSLSLSPLVDTVALLLGGFAPLTPRVPTPRAESLATASRWRGDRVAEPLCGPLTGWRGSRVAG